MSTRGVDGSPPFTPAQPLMVYRPSPPVPVPAPVARPVQDSLENDNSFTRKGLLIDTYA